ncbi:MAG: insulinase family protein [Cellvibrio sp.]
MKINKTQWLISLVISGLLVTACQPQSTKPNTVADNAAAVINNAVIQKSPNDDRTYAAILLPNKLQVVLVSDPTLENSAASLAVGAGSAQDPEGQQGLAHYLEHMLFLGTAKFPEPDGFMKFTQTNGGMTNAFTAYDKTNYLFQINATKFDEALDRFSDYFKAPTFDVNYSDKERNAVNNEWSMQKKQDPWIMMRIDGLTGNPQSPHAKFNIGNLETLVDQPNAKLNEVMKAFYQRYYSANVMRLTLVGKQSIPELKALAEKHFSNIPNRNVPMPEVTIPGLTDAEKSKSIHYAPNKDFKALYVDFPVKSNKEQWRLKPNEFVRNLLTTEEAGTLCEQLRKKGLAVNTTAYFASEAYGDDGYMRVQVELTDSGLARQDEVIAAIFAYTDLVKREGLNENYYRELQAMRAKDFLTAGKQNPLQQAVQLTTLQFDIPVENLLNAGYTYERYDEKAIKEVLDQLDTRKVRIWHISKQEKVEKPISFFDGKYDVRDITAADYARFDNLAKKYAFNLPPLNNLFTDKPAPIVESKYLKPHAVVSTAGIEAFVQQPEFYREDKGQLSLEINSTAGGKSAKNVVLANLLSDIYKKQNTTLIDRAYNASLGLAVEVSGSYSQFISITGYTTKHALLLEELLNSFAKLELSQSVFEEALVTYKEELANNSKNHVFRQLFGHVARLTHSQNWQDKELLAAAAKVNLQDVVNYYKTVKSDPLIRILAAGNYSEETVKQMAATASKILPGKRLPDARVIEGFAAPAAGKITEFKDSLDLADSAVMQAWFRDKKSYDEKAQLGVLTAFLDKAFFMQLRTNEQLGYVVQSLPYAIDDIPGYVMVVQSSNSDLVKIKSRMDKFRNEYLSELKALEPAKIEETKQAIIANITQKPTDFYKEADRYSREFWLAKYKFDARELQVAALKKVTKEDLINIYEKLLLNDKSAGMLLQIRGTNFKESTFAPLKP